MVLRHHRYKSTDSAISVSDLKDAGQGWLLDCEIRQASRHTLSRRRRLLHHLFTWLDDGLYSEVRTPELRGFLSHITAGHLLPEGRWQTGIPMVDARMKTPVGKSTVKTYHGELRAFFNWCVMEGILEVSPFETISAPIYRQDQVQPFSLDDVKALLKAAKQSPYPRRDEAILLFLLDTGIRCEELCGIRMSEIDLIQRRFRVMGKGAKTRMLSYGPTTGKALWNYLRGEERKPEHALFQAERSTGSGQHFTRSGLYQLVRRLGRNAKIQFVRCSPHTLRHTFAIFFIRSGGNVFALKEILGHTSLSMVNKYVAVAEADVQKQQWQHSPVEQLKGR